MFSLLRLAFIFSSFIKDNLIILHEDNVAYITHIKGHIKHNKVKHISSIFFYTHELPKNSKKQCLVSKIKQQCGRPIHKSITSYNT